METRLQMTINESNQLLLWCLWDIKNYVMLSMFLSSYLNWWTLTLRKELKKVMIYASNLIGIEVLNGSRMTLERNVNMNLLLIYKS